jgi:tight adherence protein C
MSASAHGGAVVGLVFGLGVMLVWRGLPRHRRPGLAERVMPYLRDTAHPAVLLGERVGGGLVAIVGAPFVRDLARLVDRVTGGAESVRSRLLRAGLPADVDRFRAEQVLWGGAGAASGAALGGGSIVVNDGSVGTAVLLTGIGVGLGVTGADWTLSRRAARREVRMLAEFPTIAELLALAVSAGEGAIGALERVCRLSHGEVSIELGRCLADVRAGANVPTALQGLADRTGLPSLRRFVDGVVIAVQRGTPLAEVLRAQAQDVREDSKRALIEAGGRKEIVMMVPVVFLILPVTVAFAVFPGMTYLQFTL